MGQIRRKFLTGDKIYTCGSCGTHLSSSLDLISKNFTSHNGKAYLFHVVENVIIDEESKDDRIMRTGLHTVADVVCCQCEIVLGWYYFTAYDSSQKYKEGKYVLEKVRMRKVLNERSAPPVLKMEAVNLKDDGYLADGSDVPFVEAEGRFYSPFVVTVTSPSNASLFAQIESGSVLDTS